MQAIKQFSLTIWNAWKRVGKFIGDLVGRVFLMLFYISVALPFGIGVALFGDPLKIKDTVQPVRWIEREPSETTIEASYNQF